MTTEKATAEIEALDFETALKRLETIVKQLEQGDVALETSIELYEQGMLLKAHCDSKLEAARTRIEAIQLAPDGTPSGTRPLDES